MKRKTFRTALALLFVSLLTISPRAQQPASATAKQSPEDRAALYQALLDLTNPWTVMCIAAHPDDEDGTSLIVMRRKYGAHTVSLFSTFGEGGQNAIGPELYEELGAIRVRETMAASEIQGSEPYFLGLKDYGFSKTADEAFRIWGHEEALRRMVLQIRKLRPDVIITNHSVTSNDHGQHQATARLTVEAFDAAADPKRFPEQLKDGVTVWQVQRLFVRARGNAQAQAATAPVVTIDPNERDPIRDTTFAEEALRGLQQHATQGPWPKTVAELASRFRMSTDGKLPLTRYVLAREAKGTDALTKDSHNFLDGLRLPEKVARQLAPPTIDGQPLTEFLERRESVFSTLAADKQRLEALSATEVNPEPDKVRIPWQLARVYQAVLLASGIKVSLRAEKDVVVGYSASFSLLVSNTGNLPVRLESLSLVTPLSPNGQNGSVNGVVILPGSSVETVLKISVPSKAQVTVPHALHLYDLGALGAPVIAVGTEEINNIRIPIVSQTMVDVAPPLEITNISPSPIVKTPATKRALAGTADCFFRDFDYKVRVTNNQDVPFSGELITEPGLGRKAASHGITIAAHNKADITLNVSGCSQSTDPKKTNQPKPEAAKFTVVGKGARTPLARLEVPIVFADARVAPDLRVGYVRGFDFSLPNALTALGVESKELSVDEVKTADLSKYASIIVDNRVYESTPGLIEVNQKLLDYAKAGGTLIVFYHKSFEWNPDERRKRPQLAPYKLILGDERVTDENAPITFLEPEHPLLNFPNKMGQEDFANWIQERGLYYPKEWDPQFHALLQSNDPGEAPLKGGLLVADYGRGHYIYTSMVWYRELRAGVPGAYRMLANMISYAAK